MIKLDPNHVFVLLLGKWSRTKRLSDPSYEEDGTHAKYREHLMQLYAATKLIPRLKEMHKQDHPEMAAQEYSLWLTDVLAKPVLAEQTIDEAAIESANALIDDVMHQGSIAAMVNPTRAQFKNAVDIEKIIRSYQ